MTWEHAFEFPALGEEEVHVWRVWLDEVDASPDVLSTAEQQRAARFLLEEPRHHYVAGRTMLRKYLAGYLGIEPRAVPIENRAGGKPFLSPPYSSLAFNVSHSRGLALFAFSRRREIGIDVEAHRESVDACAIARRFFTAAEARAIESLDTEGGRALFYRMWTLKEAYGKGTGGGLGSALSAPAGEAPGWSFTEIDPARGYSAAIAIEGNASIRCWSGISQG